MADSDAFRHGLPVQPAAANAAAQPAHSMPIPQRDTAVVVSQQGDAAEAGLELRRARIAAAAVAVSLLVLLLMMLLFAMLRRRRSRLLSRRAAVRSMHACGGLHSLVACHLAVDCVALRFVTAEFPCMNPGVWGGGGGSAILRMPRCVWIVSVTGAQHHAYTRMKCGASGM